MAPCNLILRISLITDMASIFSEARFSLIFVAILLLFVVIVVALLLCLIVRIIQGRPERRSHREKARDIESPQHSDCECLWALKH